jgi:hypothetical protein
MKLSRGFKLRVSTLQTHPKKTVNNGSTDFFGMYSRIASTNFPSFCMKNVNASLTKLTALLPQTHDCNCYISRRMLAPTLLRLHRYTYLRLGSLTLHAPEPGVFMELIFVQIYQSSWKIFTQFLRNLTLRTDVLFTIAFDTFANSNQIINVTSLRNKFKNLIYLRRICSLSGYIKYFD